MADAEKGSESHFSWVYFDDQLYFISRHGVCQWRGDASALPLSYKIDPLFIPEAINLGRMDRVYGYSYRNRIGWSLPEVGQTVPTVQIEYYPRLAQKGPGPFMFQRLPVGVFTRVRSGSTERLYGGDLYSNNLLWVYAPLGTDNGATINALLETGQFDLGAPARRKYLRRLRFIGRGKFDTQIVLDFQDTATSTHTVDIPPSPNDIGEKLVNTDVYGRHVGFRFTDSELGIADVDVEVGSKTYEVDVGEWGVYAMTVDAAVLGVRE
jgi:hypothetical protein